MKKTVIEYGVLATIALFLYFTGLHVEVIGFLQRGLLLTGLRNVSIEENASQHPDEYPKADYSLVLKDAEGQITNLSRFKGNVIFINLWATWCPPCVAEMPGINQLKNDLHDEPIVFLMVSLDDDFEKAKKFNQRKGFSLNIYQPDRGLPEFYHSQSIPTTFVISPEGKMVLKQEGIADYNTESFKSFLIGLEP